MSAKKLHISLALTLGLLALVGMLTLLGTWGSGPALAQAGTGTIRVATTGNDAPGCGGTGNPCRTVQYAVDQAADDEEIWVATGVYTGVQARAGITQVVYISKSLTVRGGYTTTNWTSNPISYPTTLDAEGLGRVVVITGPVTVTLEGLRITGGDATDLAGGPYSTDAGGGVYAHAATVTISDTAVYSNDINAQYARGAGVYIGGGHATLISNTINHNTILPRGYGGGVALVNAHATLIGNTFTDNDPRGSSTSGNAGGGVYASGGTALLSGNVISGNFGSAGAGVALQDGGIFTLTNNTIRGNDDDGVYVDKSWATLTGNTIRDNDRHGVEINHEQYDGIVHTAWLEDNDVLANQSTGVEGNSWVDQVTLIGNRVSGNQDRGVDLKGNGLLSHNVITGNQTAYDGGGIKAQGRFTFTHNVIMDNQAGRDGGGICYRNSTPQPNPQTLFLNNVIADNTCGATWHGCGIYIHSDENSRSAIRLLHNTIARNSGPEGVYLTSAGVNYEYLTVMFTNTILVSHTTGIATGFATDRPDVRMEGTLWYGNGTDVAGDVTIGTVNLYQNPAFAADGYHLTAGSPAVDQGVNVTVWTDFEDDARPADYGFDLGADEVAGTALQMLKRAGSSVLEHGQTVTYTMSVTVAGGTATNLLITDTLPAQQQVGTLQVSSGTCTLIPGWGGGGACDVGTVPSGTTVLLTMTAQMTSTPPLPADMPVPMTNTLTARSSEAGYEIYAPLRFQYCRANLNGTIYTGVQDAVDAANDGDLVKVAGYCQGMNGRGSELAYVTRTLTLRGGYTIGDWNTSDPAVNPTTLDGQRQGRVLYINGAGITVTVEGFHIINGNAFGLGAQGGSGVDSGGGLFADQSAVVLRNNVVQHNYARYDPNALVPGEDGYGGGICLAHPGQADLISNTITYNVSQHGGGLYAYNSTGPVTLRGNLISSNTVGCGNGCTGGYGGGVCLYDAPATFDSNTIQSNRAHYGGGGVYAGYNHNDPVIFISNTIQNNSVGGSTSDGGGVLFSRSDALLSANDILSNTAADDGGGVAATYGCDIEFNDNLIAGNQADGNGGGLYTWYDGSTVLNNNIIRDNVASGWEGWGGGAYLDNDATLDGNLIYSNVATGTNNSGGGGLYLGRSEDFVLRNNVVSDNYTDREGGGLYLYCQSTFDLLHNTIARNASGNGSAVYVDDQYGASTAYFTNTIIYSQTIGVVNGRNGTNVISLTHTLWESVTTRTVGTVGDLSPIAGSAAFAADGYHLTDASDAIDAGVDTGVAHDVDGQPRSMGPASDIGADEHPYYADLSLSKVRQGSGPVLAGTSITFTLTVSNSAASGWDADGLLVDTFDPAVAVSTLSADASPGDVCQTAGTVVTCTLSNVLTGTTRIVTLTVTTTATYSGTLTNSATVTPTDAIDPDGSDNAAGPIIVTIVTQAPCAAPDDVALDGPPPTTVGLAATFTATVTPPTTTLPVTYTWEATDRPDVVHTGGGLSDTVDFTWNVAGTKTVTVTAVNGCGIVSATHVITVEAPLDTDGDGVIDVVEDGAPHGGDGNEDGTPDRLQADVASLPNAEDGRYVTLESPPGTNMTGVQAVGNPSPGDAPPLNFPYGFFSFTINNVGVGDTAVLTLTLPDAVPDTTEYWKYGPTVADPTDHWYQIPVGDNDGDDLITISLTDGGDGDDDLAANGVIVDQGGPGMPGQPVGGVSVPLSRGVVVEWLGLVMLAVLGTLTAALVRRKT